jgi:hypothetical protein
VASFTVGGQRWADGTSVGAYPAAAWPDTTQAPSGSAVATAAVAGGAVTFTGLSENVRYVAYAVGVGVRFVVPQVDPTDARSLRSRVDDLTGDTMPAVDSRVGTLEGTVDDLRSPVVLPAAPLDPATAGVFNSMSIASPDMWFDAGQIDAGTYVLDRFWRADDATSLGTAESGQAWSAGSGLVGISGHKAYMPSGTSAIWFLSTRISDHRMDASVTLAPTTAEVDLYPRYLSTTNYIQVRIVKDAVNNLIEVNSRVANTPTQLAINSAAGLANNTTYTVRVVSKSNVYQVYVNDVLKVTATDAGNNFVTGISQAIGFANSDTLSRIFAYGISGAPLVDGDTVAGWVDLAKPQSYAHAIQSTVANRPIYKTGIQNGRPVVRFDGVDDRLTSLVPADQNPFTLIAVVIRSTATDNDTIVGPNNNGGVHFRINTAGTLQILAGGVASIGTSTDTVTTAKASVLAVTYDGVGRYVFYIDGRPAQLSRVAQALTGGTTVNIGAFGASSDPFAGDIGEIVRWPRVLLGHDLKAAMLGLAAKWGVTLKQRLGKPTGRPTIFARIKGASVHPKSGQSSYNGNSLSGFWGPGYDFAWIQSSIDDAVAAGANTIRTIGDVEAVYTGLVSQGTYNTRLAQIADYCASVNVGYLYAGADFRHLGGADPTFIRDKLVSEATVLASRSNVIAIELVNEIGASYGNVVPERTAFAWLSMWATAVRAVAPNVALTASEPGGQSFGQPEADTERSADYTRFSRIDWADFYVMHYYGTTPYDYMLNPLIVMADKPVLIGEYGMDVAAGGAARTAFYNAIDSVIDNNPSDVLGGINWAARNDTYGLYSETGNTAQTDISVPFAAMTGGRVLR